MRQFLHKLVGLTSWIVLAILWAVLAIEHKATGAAFRDTAFQLAAIAAVLLAITLWWIRHNVSIYRRKGPREARVTHPPRTDADRLGRRLHWTLPGGVDGARAQQHLVIELDGDVKTYRQAA
jgi:hypothetical protein